MANPIKRFFLFCSGATRAVLDMNGCEVEHNKYAGIGATIFFTATLAALSGGYAMFTVFQEPATAVSFGLLWGLIIFNLDRFIVSSMRKKRVGANLTFGRRSALRAGEFAKALPRLVLAVFISIVITRPIELRLFESEIQGQITHDLIRDRTKLIEDINTEYDDIRQTREATEGLRSRLMALQDEERARDDAAKRELEGWAGTHRRGAGEEYQKRLADLKIARQQLQDFRDQYGHVIEEDENRIRARTAERDAKLREAAEVVNKSPGLLKRLEALSTLTRNSTPMLLASLFIIFLFISLETAPILVKLFSSRGPYDDHLDAMEHTVYATQQQAVSDLNLQINIANAQNKQMSAYRSQHELQLYQQTLASLPTLVPKEFQAAQEEVARRAVERWLAGQLLNLGNSAPATYLSQPLAPFTQAAATAAAATPPPNVPQPPGPAVATPAAPTNPGQQPSNGTAVHIGGGAQAGAQGSAAPFAASSAPAVGSQTPAASPAAGAQSTQSTTTP